MTLRNAMWTATLIGIVLLLWIVAKSPIIERIEALERRVEALETQVVELEDREAEVERQTAQLEEENVDLNWWIRWLRQGQDRLFGYYADSVLVDTDISIGPEMDLEILAGGYQYKDFHPSALFELERPFLVRMGLADWVDLSDELQPGDRLQIWCNPNQPTSGVSFWDNQSCLVLNLQHLDGVYAAITR